ncbi:hypothetical protein KY308_04015, partial [Candidatus Woesearchaeota archaeon]|nr:hypothetical protein [Candidatus Woesearchaeota archaeon]
SAPRIIVNGNVYALKYDLPDDNKILPFEKYPEAYSKENLQENFNIADLGRITEIVEQKDRQIIFSTKGRIEIRNGVCFSNSFLMADIPGATFVIKTLLWPYNHS